jgi:hypothetical protein
MFKDSDTGLAAVPDQVYKKYTITETSVIYESVSSRVVSKCL